MELSLPPMYRRLIYICLACLFLFACRKENDRPQWDIAILGPLLHASIGIDQLISDTLLTADGSEAQIVSYDKLLSAFDLDTIAQVEDTSIQTISLFPPFSSVIGPNFPFVSNNNNIVLGLGNLLLKEAIVKSGKIKLEIKNTLQSKIYFTYTIPKATKNNLAFTATAVVDSGSLSDPKYFTGEFDMTGYELDLTGVSGNSFNTISYNVRAVSDPDGDSLHMMGSDTIVNLTTTLLSILPSYAKGYLGQNQNTDVNQTELEFAKVFKSGLLKLDSVKINLDLINSIGADAQFYINSIQSINTRNGTTINLLAPSVVQHNININRASETGNVNDPVTTTNYSIQLDHTNSNVLSFVENLPDQIYSDFNLKINPLGNVSGSNDFIYTDRLLDTRLRILMPLRFAMNQLVLADTVPFSISNATNFDAIGEAVFTLIADNSFPIDLNVQLFLIDSTNTIVDSLFVPDLIARAPVDINYRSQGSTRTIIKIPIDADRKNRLLSVQNAGVRIRFNTPDYPQLVQMYSDYRVDLKLIADGIYSIR